jgi:glycosyltransferase involved in cell wall biosynthesis
VSVYGARNAGVRARALTWLARLGLAPELVSYLGGNEAGASALSRSPVRAGSSEWRLRRLVRRQPGVLLLSREASPLSKGSIEERLLGGAGRGVYDLDDALYADVRGRAFEALFSKSAKVARAARASDVVVVGNEDLAGWASALHRDVHIVPTCVEPSDYELKEDYEVADAPRLVWMGTPSGETYLRDIAPSLLEVNRRTGARLTIVGAGAQSLGALAGMTDRVDWSLDFAHTGLQSFDIGLMPLRDSRYERGKCAYKLLEYGAAGLPFVGSPVGANAAILKRSGAPAPVTSRDWVDALLGILELTAEDRNEQATSQLQVIEESYSFDRWMTRWRTAVFG